METSEAVSGMIPVLSDSPYLLPGTLALLSELPWIIGVLGFLLGLLSFFVLYRWKLGAVIQGKADLRVLEAKKETELMRKEVDLEAKNFVFKAKADLEKELTARREELALMEKRVISKEEVVEKKYNFLDKKEIEVRTKEERCIKKEQDIDAIHSAIQKTLEDQKRQLLNMAHWNEDEAKQQVLKNLESELEADRVRLIKKKEAEIRLQAEKKAQNILVLSIQRQALDQCQDHATKLIPIPNDEMKGRIIGREGRNIRAFEHVCGCDVIVDDTPDAILISCFDPVRRHIARAAMEILIQDGKVHPARIEEVVAKVRRETGNMIREGAEVAVAELGLTPMHPEIMKLLGQLQFRTSYGQQQLKHSMEVSQIAGVMAAELGVDVKLAKRAALLHDIGKALTHEMEGSHAMIGADLCRKYGESADVEHAVRAHHRDVEPRTIFAFIVDSADAMSGGRPGARSKTEANYIQRLEKIEEICMSFRGVDRSYAVQAGRDVRVFVNPSKISDDQAILMASDISRRIETDVQFPGQIKVSVIRESRAIEFAH
jgi:ribonuclease Y